MKFKRKVHILLAMVCFILCFAITLQYKSVTRNQSLEKESLSRDNDMENNLINARQQNIDLQKENMQLHTDLEAYRKEAASNSDGAEALKKEMEKYRTMSGLTNVKGPGITIEVADSTKTDTASDSGIVHDTDLLSLVNELYAAGAEAVCINEERLIISSPIRCVGNTIMVNNKRCSSPYKIKAIGDSEALYTAINMRGGICEQMKRDSLGVNVTKNSSLTMEKYNGVIDMNYAEDSQ